MAFRSKHLETVLEEYYSVFSSYLEGCGVKVEFSTFRKECEKWRAPISLVFGNSLLFIVLNPEPQSLDTWSSLKKMQRDMTVMIGGEAKETGHLLIKEIRKRNTEGILEFDALGLFG